ncbi:Bicarbonate transport ATP-binding protein CmpD [bacterium YEK0313]|nr:Bicarbonate transport ATP-binding protein CmpD [bacterium YEK0313]
MSDLLIKAVSRTFPGVQGGAPTQALAPVDLTVSEGEFVAILGPSGCGKSTLLRVVAGLDHPTSGSVTLDGAPVTEPGADRGMVFQSYTLFPWLTVAENIAFGPRERGVGAAERRAIAEKLMAQVGLTQFANHYPKMLSGGMQQRAALARALANDPKVLILDEPFGALDHQTRSLMQELLLSIWEAHHKTVLFVTHDIEEAVFMANRVLVMSARPGRFKCEVAVPFPHPRSYKIKTTPEFAALEERLTEEIRGETMLAVSSGL